MAKKSAASNGKAVKAGAQPPAGKSVGKDAASTSQAGSTVHRYKESRRRVAQQQGANSDVIAAGKGGMFVNPEDVELLEDEQANVQDLDEPTLGQRLRGIRAANAAAAAFDEEEDEDDEDEDDEDEEEDDGEDEDGLEGNRNTRRRPRAAPLPAGSLSLGETLTQALHSNDTAMLSSCLAHSDATIIRLSVSRLSGPLALRLLEHCIDRMARGGRRSTGQLASGRARGIIEWVRATLTAHTGYLMSLPSLVSRLAQLHSTLATRLASQERLLALNGRLELVLSQIELRAAYASEQAKVQGVRRKAHPNGKGSKSTGRSKVTDDREWVETSSDEDDEVMDVDASSVDGVDAEDSEDEGDDDDDADGVPIVRAEEIGGIQEIALGNPTSARSSRRGKKDVSESEESGDEEEDEVLEEDDEEDDDDEEEGYDLLDLEAEESDDEEDSDDD